MPPYAANEVDPVFRAVCSHWLDKLSIAYRHRRRVFTLSANECFRFYAGHRHWEDALSGDIGGLHAAELPADPSFKVTVNKTFEFVTIFGPFLYSQNPVRTVKPRQPVIVPPIFYGPDLLTYQAKLQEESVRVQTEGLTSVLLEAYLNWASNEYCLDKQSRLAVDEALIKGRGVLWPEVYTPPGGGFNVVRSVWDTVDHFYCDPDAGNIENSQWVCRKMIEPVWKVERDRGLRPGSLKGNLESQAKHGELEREEDAEYNRVRGLTNDLLVYHKIYSRMGAGGRLQGLAKQYREPLEQLGDYVYLEIADGVPFPLNLPPDVEDRPEFQANPDYINDLLAWPTPYWAANKWPCAILDFHRVFNCPWPKPHLQAAMGELKFLNWANSFLMGHLRNTTRDFIAVKKEAGEEIKSHILNGGDLTLLELEAAHGTISELVSFLQHPQVNGDIWKLIAEVENNFERRVGLNELMYGMQGESAIRSASEANMRNQNTQIRPDDMRKQVEAWQTEIACLEAMTARYHLTGNDVKPAFGMMGAEAWDQYVASRDLDIVSHQLEYRIEAGSTARPNKQWEISTISQAFQVLAPIFQTYSMSTGDMTPLNSLVTDLAKSLDLDPNRYQLRSPMPMPQPGAPPGEEPQGEGGPPGGHQSQASSNIPPPG